MNGGGPCPLIVIGPTPPPIHGGAFAQLHVLEGLRRADLMAIHVETSDPRPVWTTNRLDLLNVWFASKHSLVLTVALLREREADVYLPLSQGRWGFLRDAVLIALARVAGRRVVVHLHGGLFADFYRDSSPPERALIRWTLRGVDRAWVLTEAHVGIFDGLIPRDRVEVLENCGDDMGPPQRGEAGGPLRLLYLSNLFAEKGPFVLLDGLELLAREGCAIEIRLVGEATAEVAAEVEARCSALSGRGIAASWLGPLVGERKREQYRWAHAFVLPTKYPPEGQPLVLLEAMSAGLAIVSTEHSGIPWTVRDGVEGLIVPPEDPQALAGALRRLLDEDGLVEALGRAGRTRYEDVYTPEAFYSRLAALAGATAAGGAGGALTDRATPSIGSSSGSP
ncbi:MAG: glycosyltransferase family 4 protein [Actinomycetota bacterium]|nr:glycosyltransferase family 4 protein [Actinomycetota bacterium]